MKRNTSMPQIPGMPTEEKSRKLATLLDEKQGENIVVLDVTGISPLAEHIIVVTGKGQRHVQALADAVVHMAREEKFISFGVEGYETGTWILVDLNDISVHIFLEDVRSFYNIEGLWSEGTRVEWLAASALAPGQGSGPGAQ